MHNAPTVNYPLGRSRFQAWLTAGTCLLALLAGLLWCTQVGATGWRQGVWLFGWLTSSLLAFQSWRQTPVGVLRWDGESWCWVREAHSTSGALAVHMDFQFFWGGGPFKGVATMVAGKFLNRFGLLFHTSRRSMKLHQQHGLFTQA